MRYELIDKLAMIRNINGAIKLINENEEMSEGEKDFSISCFRVLVDILDKTKGYIVEKEDV